LHPLLGEKLVERLKEMGFRMEERGYGKPEEQSGKISRFFWGGDR
jgi:hypothetical protein